MKGQGWPLLATAGVYWNCTHRCKQNGAAWLCTDLDPVLLLPTSSWPWLLTEDDLGCNWRMALNKAKVSFWAKVMLALSCRPKISGMSLSGRVLM